MSILLEALRKSEKKQASREVPTIHSEVPSSEPAGFPMRLLLILLLVVTLAVSAWFVWQQYRVPGDNEAAEGEPAVPQTSSATAEGNEAVKQAADTNAAGRPGINQASNPAPRTASTSPGSAAETPASNTTGARTPMESYQPPATSGEPGSDTTQPGSSSAATSNRNTSYQPVSSLNQRRTNSDGTQSAAEKAAEARSREPQPIGYWELPDAIRADVPPVKYTVLVYDQDPSKRFVLINGERLGEGDSLQPGLEVREIRRDGVVFSYRLYRFLVER